jgi:hypothetical protein
MKAERFVITRKCITLEEWGLLLKKDTSLLDDEQFLIESDRISLEN